MLSASAITPKQDNSLPIGPNFISVHFGEENGCQKVVLGIFLSIAKVGRQGGREKENKSPRECDHSPLKSSVNEWQVIPGLPAISPLSPLPSFLHRPLLSSSTNLEAPWFLNPLLPVASQWLYLTPCVTACSSITLKNITQWFLRSPPTPKMSGFHFCGSVIPMPFFFHSKVETVEPCACATKTPLLSCNLAYSGELKEIVVSQIPLIHMLVPQFLISIISLTLDFFLKLSYFHT